MNKYNYVRMIVIALLIGSQVQSGKAATVNTWRGDDVSADWNEAYQWKLNHPPAEGEAAHFREANSVVSVNSTVQLNNGIHLYGEELLLKGNGNINLWSVIPHERTVNIPASATGYANLTLCDNLSLNGRISLSAKGFGTSASKGSITLKDRSTVTGGLCIGNEGVGSGQVYIKDNATYRITKLELNTIANKGGMAEIHILGGTVRIETAEDLFNTFMEDASRKIIIGDTGTLRVESNLPIAEKKEMIKALIVSKRLVAAPGCYLTPPILQDEMMIARAESARLSSTTQSQESLLAAIDNISNAAATTSDTTSSDLGELVKALHNESTNPTQTVAQTETTNPDTSGPHLAGYIVFFGVALFALRRAPSDGQV
jgi:hypothetical protein